MREYSTRMLQFFNFNNTFGSGKVEWRTKNLVNPGLNIKVDSMYDCLNNIFCTAKLSMLHGFTIGVSVDVL